jgi:hypothetical protein
MQGYKTLKLKLFIFTSYINWLVYLSETIKLNKDGILLKLKASFGLYY